MDVTDFESLAAAPTPRPRWSARSSSTGTTSSPGSRCATARSSTTGRRPPRTGSASGLAGALDRLVAACIADGDLARAAQHARRWLALDPLHEPAHQALIRLLAWTGQRSAALRQYRTLVRILDSELAVRPLPETTQLYDDVRAGRLAPAPVAAAAPGVAAPAVAAARPAAGSPPATAPAAGLPARAGTVLAGTVLAGTVPAGTAGWPLVGRADELHALHAAWREITAGGRVAAVVGAAGCGKTRLVEEFRSGVQAAGAVVLASRCHDGEGELPFVVAADLLRSALSVCPELPARLPAHAAAMTGRLCPELAADYPDVPAPLDSPLALTRLYTAIGEALRTAATAGAAPPVAGVVLVEDVHWADGPSLDLLAYLIRRLAGWPLLLVLSWTVDQADRLRGLRAAVSEASDAARGTVIEPAPLREEQIQELLTSSGVPDADVAQLLDPDPGPADAGA